MPEIPDKDHQPPPPPPPPRRGVKRKLSLNAAMEKVRKKKEAADDRPLFDPQDEFPQPEISKTEDQGTHLHELKDEIVNREGLLAEKEKRLGFWETDLNEREALLEAHQKLLKTDKGGEDTTSSATAGTNEEKQALEALRKELETKEASLKEAREMLNEREEYIEQCENELVEKSMRLTEREAEIEQLEVNSGITND